MYCKCYHHFQITTPMMVTTGVKLKHSLVFALTLYYFYLTLKFSVFRTLAAGRKQIGKKQNHLCRLCSHNSSAKSLEETSWNKSSCLSKQPKFQSIISKLTTTSNFLVEKLYGVEVQPSALCYSFNSYLHKKQHILIQLNFILILYDPILLS